MSPEDHELPAIVSARYSSLPLSRGNYAAEDKKAMLRTSR